MVCRVVCSREGAGHCKLFYSYSDMNGLRVEDDNADGSAAPPFASASLPAPAPKKGLSKKEAQKKEADDTRALLEAGLLAFRPVLQAATSTLTNGTLVAGTGHNAGYVTQLLQYGVPGKSGTVKVPSLAFVRRLVAAVDAAQQLQLQPLVELLEAKEKTKGAQREAMAAFQAKAQQLLLAGDVSMLYRSMQSTFVHLFEFFVQPATAELMAADSCASWDGHVQQAVGLEEVDAEQKWCCSSCGWPLASAGRRDQHERTCPRKLLANANNGDISMWDLGRVLLRSLKHPGCFGAHLLLAAAVKDAASPLHGAVSTLLVEANSLLRLRLDSLESALRLVKFNHRKGADGVISLQLLLDVGEHFYRRSLQEPPPPRHELEPLAAYSNLEAKGRLSELAARLQTDYNLKLRDTSSKSRAKCSPSAHLLKALGALCYERTGDGDDAFAAVPWLQDCLYGGVGASGWGHGRSGAVGHGGAAGVALQADRDHAVNELFIPLLRRMKANPMHDFGPGTLSVGNHLKALWGFQGADKFYVLRWQTSRWADGRVDGSFFHVLDAVMHDGMGVGRYDAETVWEAVRAGHDPTPTLLDDEARGERVKNLVSDWETGQTTLIIGSPLLAEFDQPCGTLPSGARFELPPLVSCSLLMPLDARAPGQAHVGPRPPIEKMVAAIKEGVSAQLDSGALSEEKMVAARSLPPRGSSSRAPPPRASDGQTGRRAGSKQAAKRPLNSSPPRKGGGESDFEQAT